MRLTARGLNRATLQRQLLLQRGPWSVTDAVHRIFAIQAQEPVSPYLALWNRIEGFAPAELDAAFAAREVVKSTLMRITLHAVTAADQPVLHAAMRPRLRASRLGDARFRELGISVADADEALAALRPFLSSPRGNAEIEAELAARFGELPKPGLWWALRTFGPVHHAPTGATWTFGPRPSYVAAPAAAEIDPEDAVRHYVRRYLEAFGPATVADIAQFSLLLRPTVRAAAAKLDLVTFEGADGVELLDVPEGPRPDEDVAAPPRLMAMWDSVLFAHTDRARVIPPEYRAFVIRRNGDTLATVLVDGYVAGVWRPGGDGIEISAFRTLSRATWDALADEATRLLEFLEPRENTVHRRYERWWQTLPACEVRVLR